MQRRSSAWLALSLLVPVLTAQQTKGDRLPADAWRVPIHTASDDPVGGRYGIWAGGETFKASFHDGFRFVPVLGKEYPHNLPVAWQTTGVRVGTTPLLTASEPASPHQVGGWRYEYRWPGVTEAYDVRAEGVEQTFVLARRPDAKGDLVISGALTTELVAAPRVAQHAEIVFAGPSGEGLVRYGAAFAVDATGLRVPVTTAWDGKELAITVPEATLAAAAYPLTVDPLFARVTLDTWGASFGLVVATSVARDDEATTRNVFTFWARNVSLTDYDAYGILSNDDFSNAVSVFTDITTSWATVDGDVTFVGGADRFALTLQRDFPGTTTFSGIRCYLHDSGNSTLNSGTTLFLTIPSGETNRTPSIGGVAGFFAGTKALIVYTADITIAQTNTINTEAWAVVVDAATPSLGTRFLLSYGNTSGGRSVDREWPEVTQYAAGTDDSWIVAWQQFNNAVSNQSWAVQAVRVRQDGTIGGLVSGFFGASGFSHYIRPKVDGQNGRYMLTYLRTDTINQGFGKQLETYRFDWPNGAGSTSIAYKQNRILTTSASNNLVQGGISYDDYSESHWAIVFQQSGLPNSSLFLRRVGYTGGVTEAATLHVPTTGDGAHMGSVTFDNDTDEFQIVYATLGTGGPVYGRVFYFPTNAASIAYGTSCGGTISSTSPYAGSEFFSIGLFGAAANQNAVLFVASGSSALDLAPYGMPSCFLNVNPALIAASVPVVINALGGAAIPIALPDAPLVTGNVYVQWAHVDPAAPWALKVRSTQGLLVQIR